MTSTQVTQFLEQGAVTIDTPLQREEVARANDLIGQLAPFYSPDERAQPRYRATASGYFDAPLIDLIQHPFFEDVAKQALNAATVHFFQTVAIVSYPQPDTPFTFDEHVDIQYRLSDFEAVPRRIVCSFFLWLTDVNERRAPMMFRPRSHLRLAQENERRGPGDDEQGKVTSAPYARLPLLDYASPIPLTARAGQVSVLTTAAIHGASVNLDNAARTAMLITFVADGVEIPLPPGQAEHKRSYDQALRPLLRPGRQHIIEPCK